MWSKWALLLLVVVILILFVPVLLRGYVRKHTDSCLKDKSDPGSDNSQPNVTIRDHDDDEKDDEDDEDDDDLGFDTGVLDYD